MRKLPAMLSLHNSAMLQTAPIQISVTIYLKGKAAKSTHKVFY